VPLGMCEISTDNLGEMEDTESWTCEGNGARNASWDNRLVPEPPASSVDESIWGDRGCAMVIALSNSDKPGR
jgi:hypothetical protein